MSTLIDRVDLTTPEVDQQIVNLCTVRGAAGLQLAATFTYGTDLVLIFQS